MAFIGLTFTAAITHMVDIQVRFAMKYFNGEMTLPSVTDMKTDSQRYVDIRRAAGLPKRKLLTLIGPLQVSMR